MQTHRNAPCPCGSGRKHKRCCAGQLAASSSPRGASRTLMALAFLLALGGLGYALFGGRSAEDDPPPGGEAAGRVWCESHGGWHEGEH